MATEDWATCEAEASVAKGVLLRVVSSAKRRRVEYEVEARLLRLSAAVVVVEEEARLSQVQQMAEVVLVEEVCLLSLKAVEVLEEVEARL